MSVILLLGFEARLILYSQPDLPARVLKDIPFTPYNRDTFYNAGSPEGYVTHPFADKESEALYNEKKRERDAKASKSSL